MKNKEKNCQHLFFSDQMLEELNEDDKETLFSLFLKAGRTLKEKGVEKTSYKVIKVLTKEEHDDIIKERLEEENSFF